MSNEYKYTRIPFLILPYINKDIAVPKELMYDEDTKKLYVRSLDGLTDIEIGKSYLEEIIDIEIEIIKSSVSEDGDSFEKIVNLINSLILWKESIINSPNNDIIADLTDIIDKFKGLEESDPTLLGLIKSKVDKIPGKGLSTNDFSNELLAKLNSIEEKANNYTHPIDIQCSYRAPVLSVNDRVGDVVITKEELGFGNVQEGAIHYTHPLAKQCNFSGISSVNGRTGVITVDKSFIGLSEVQNSDVADIGRDELKYCIDKYMTPYTGQFMLSKIINKEYSNLKRNELPDSVIYEYLVGLLYKLNITTNPIDCDVKISGDNFFSTKKLNEVKSGDYRITAYKQVLYSISQNISVMNRDTNVTISLPKSNLYFKGVNRFAKSELPISSYIPVSNVDYVVPVLNTIVRKDSSYCELIYDDEYRDPQIVEKGINFKYGRSNIQSLVYHTVFRVFLYNYNSDFIRFGNNYNGELGGGSTGTSSDVLVSSKSFKYNDIKQILPTNRSTFILYTNGIVEGAGSNSLGALLDSDFNKEIYTFTELPSLTNVQSIHGDGITNFAIFKDGTVKGWGYNYQGELAMGYITNVKTTPVNISLNDVKDIKISKGSVYFIKNNNDIYVCGNNNNKELSTVSGDVLTPKKFSLSMNTVKELVPYDHGMFFLMNDGTVKVAGSNPNGTAGVLENEPIGIKNVPISNVKKIYNFGFKTLFLMNDGTVRGCANDDSSRIIPSNSGNSIVTIFNEAPVVEIVPTFNGYGVFFVLDK